MGIAIIISIFQIYNLEKLAKLVGIKTVSNFLFFLGFIFFIFIVFDISKTISIQNKKIVTLTQELALLRKDINNNKINIFSRNKFFIRFRFVYNIYFNFWQ